MMMIAPNSLVRQRKGVQGEEKERKRREVKEREVPAGIPTPDADTPTP